MEQNLLTKKELAECLKVSETTVNRLIAKGLPHIKVGSQVRLNLEECLNWLREKRNK